MSRRDPSGQTVKGRSSGFNPKNRFLELYLEPVEDGPWYDEFENGTFSPLGRKVPTTFFIDTSKTILAKNDSPDIPFTYSLNPYRGCEHGCIYCYARPSHEYLGFSSGLDFETKIMVKRDAPELLRETFMKKSWEPQVVSLSGNTDCYQPAERKLKLTRRCLEVFLEFRNPVGIVTKNALVQRDIDILEEMAKLNIVSVLLSITTLDQELARKMEPRTSPPFKRLETIELLASHGIDVGVNASPIIPGLNDEEIPAILQAAKDHGAEFASTTIARFPYAVKELFIDWLDREFPLKKEKILSRVKMVHGGKMNSSEFGKRMSGKGEIAEVIHDLFKTNVRRLGLNRARYHLTVDHFRRNPRQIEMF